MESRSGRIDEIDVMRGIGILLVVIGHVFPVGERVHAFIYSFHMPLFFIISGMTLSVDGESRISQKSDMRLVKEYLSYSALYIAFDVIVRQLILKTYTMSDVVTDLQNTLLLFGISVLWFIPAIVGARILVRVILSKSRLSFQIGMCFVLICIGLYVPYHDKQTCITKIFLVLQRISMASSYVIVGFYLRRYILPRIKNLIVLIFAGLPNVLLTAAATGIDFRTLSGGDVALAILLSLSGTLMVVGMASLLSHISKLKSWFKYLSSQSLRIMVFHSYLMLPGLIDVILGYMRFRLNSVLYCSVKSITLMISVILICIAIDGIKNKQKDWMRQASR